MECGDSVARQSADQLVGGIPVSILGALPFAVGVTKASSGVGGCGRHAGLPSLSWTVDIVGVVSAGGNSYVGDDDVVSSFREEE